MEQKPFAKVPGLVYLQAGGSYSGSHQGMRWRIFVQDGQFAAAVWPNPWNYAHTDDALKTHAHFPADEDGLHEAERWVDAQYYADVPRWKKAAESETF